MRIGLISDVHANAKALRTALDIFVGQKVDKILCMGDLVEKGSDGDEVVATIQSWLIPCVRGNHDEMATENQKWIVHDLMMADDGWGDLKDATLDYLQSLAFSRYYIWGKRRILMVHGSTASNWDYLYPYTEPRRFKNIAAKADADIVLSGHTHQAMHVLYHNVHFINPGSVSELGSHTCAILDIETYDLQIFDLRTGNSKFLNVTNADRK